MKKDEITILQLLDKHLGHVKIDKRFVGEVYKYHLGYVVENATYLGGVLMGVEPLYFKSSKVNYLFNVILEINQSEIIMDYKLAPGIVPSHKIASDVFNLTVFYLTYRVNKSKLSKKLKRQAMESLMSVFFLRSLSALNSARFSKFLADPAVAKEVYERLSNRFILKKVGSWNKYIEYRVNAVLSGEANLYVAIENFSPDKKVTDIIADSQKQIRSTVNFIYGVFKDVIEEGEGIKTESSEDDFGDEATTKDITMSLYGDIENILKELPDKHSWHDSRITTLVLSTMPGMKLQHAEDSITYMSDHGLDVKVQEAVRDSATFSYNYLESRGYFTERSKNLRDLLNSLKFAIGASRSTEAALKSLRISVDALAVKATGIRNKQKLSNIRNFIIMYVFTKVYLR